jgi:glycosyltransferase involved in cell wall biosynthesis
MEVYADLDIFVLPSITEGTPITLLEAMAAGKASIASNVGGIADIASENEVVLCESDNLNLFTDGLQELIVDDALRKRLGANARDRVFREFDIRNLLKETLEIYNEQRTSYRNRTNGY